MLLEPIIQRELNLALKKGQWKRLPLFNVYSTFACQIELELELELELGLELELELELKTEL